MKTEWVFICIWGGMTDNLESFKTVIPVQKYNKKMN